MILSFADYVKENKVVIIIWLWVLLFLIGAVYWIIEMLRGRKTTVAQVSTIGIFTGLAFCLYYVEFSLPFFPSFLKINFSALPIIMTSFIFGKREGITICLLRAIIKLPFTGTYCIGELCDLFITSGIVIVAGTIYQHWKSKKGAITALGLGAITWVVVAIIVNWLIIIPAYILLIFEGNVENFVGAIGVIPNITVDNYMIKYLLYAALPFNALAATLILTITYFVYKHVSAAIHRFEKVENEDFS